MNQTENELVPSALQKKLGKLMSEQYFVYQACQLAPLACVKEEAGIIEQLFMQIGRKNMVDGMLPLAQWCRETGCDIPCSESEFKRSAAKEIQTAANLKKKQNAGYYIGVLAEMIGALAESFKAVLDERSSVCEFTDLQGMLWNQYYNLVEMLRELNSAQIAYDANDSLIM